MNLREELLKLAGLAQTENEVIKAQKRLDELSQKLSSYQDTLKQKQSLFLSLEKQVEEKEKELKQTENELEDSKLKIKQREEKLYEIKTNKEFQAVQKEISEAKKLNKERENIILQIMELLETLKPELQNASEEQTMALNTLNHEQGSITQEQEKLHQELEILKENKQNLFSTLPEQLTFKYERVLVRRQPALAGVKNGICQSCHIHLPPQMNLEVQKMLDIYSCPACNRLLYIANDYS